jgi:hypothetical protein
LQRFVGERLALQGERFEVFLYLAEGIGLRALTLLEPLLINLELLLQGFNQCLYRLLSLRQVTLRRFLELAERLVGQPKKFGRRLFQRIGAEGFERVP